MLLFVISCRSVGSSYNKGDDSQLAGVYDSTTLLRLSAAPEKPGLFHFEACLKDQQQNVVVAKEGGCIGALRTLAGEDITFTLMSLDTKSSGDAEKAYLQDLQSDWKNYQKKLRASAAGVGAISMVVLGLSAAVKSRQQSALVAVQEAAQKLNPESAEAIGSEIAKSEQLLRGAGLDPKGVVTATDDLSSLAGARPAGVVVGEGGELAFLVGKRGERSILTPEFRSHFRKVAKTMYVEATGPGVTGIQFRQARLNELVNSIVGDYLYANSSKSLNDIFEPRWLNGFFKYQGIEAAMRGEQTLLMRSADELTAALKKAPAQVLQSAQDYVFHEAISPAASDISQGLVHMRSQLNVLKNSAGKLSQALTRAQRNMRLARAGMILAVIAAGGAVFAALKAHGTSTDADLQAPLNASQLEVLVDKSANTQVSSVQQVLEGVSLYLTSRAAFDASLADNLRVHHYCWPASRGQGNRMRAQCQRVAAYR